MPSFTSQVPNLQGVGPIVDIRIAIGREVEAVLRASGTAVPPPLQAVAMIDTGATGSVIRQGLAAQLGLNPVGVTYINTPSSTNVPCHILLNGDSIVSLMIDKGFGVSRTPLYIYEERPNELIGEGEV